MSSGARRLAGILALLFHSAVIGTPPPAPIAPTPAAAQLAWHELEFYGFIHFTTNTFTDREWGMGDESPKIFNPTSLDCRQWVRIAKEAGMRGLILTAKHHDGFCLWPSKLTSHSVKSSPWKDGKGDVVGELAEACRAEGLKFGVYLSPWDRNHAEYGKPPYVDYYHAQARELLTNYGPIFEFWLDGANGGDGYYGGARDKRVIDRKTYYRLPQIVSLVRELQPSACIFSDIGPDVRWVGNEKGFAGETCWAMYTPHGVKPGEAPSIGETMFKEGETGHADGRFWMPAEVDVSIRPGWFYHAAEDDKVKSPEKLFDIWYESVGRGANLLLNVPPDRRGLIHDADIAALRGMRRILDQTFAVDLARSAKSRVEPSLAQRVGANFESANLTDGHANTYWAAADGVTRVAVVFDFPAPVTFDLVQLREYITPGQRVSSFAIDVWKDGAWQEHAHGTTIGRRRIIRTTAVTTPKVRLRILDARACPTISEFALFRSR